MPGQREHFEAQYKEQHVNYCFRNCNIRTITRLPSLQADFMFVILSINILKLKDVMLVVCDTSEDKT
jgi:hypothetical protein